RSMVLVLVIAATASMGGYAFARSGPTRAPARRTSPAGGDRTVMRISIPGRLSVVVPTGWHVLHGWLSDVTDPAPRLAMASFPARLSHHTCECGFPNVLNFPRNGAFIFVWEYLHYPTASSLGYRAAPPTSRSRMAKGCASPAVAPTAASPSRMPGESSKLRSISAPTPGRRCVPEQPRR
ncbi:MAG: hypothetical protein ACRDNS_12595, partial [Trebonia sp.]